MEFKNHKFESFKTSFSNTENLKGTIQNLASNNEVFYSALLNIKGDHYKNAQHNFNGLINNSLAYFFNEVLNESIVYNEWYTLESVKGMFDKNYISDYTAIYNYSGANVILNVDAKYINECYLLINFAYYQNKIDLVNTDFFKYSYHYLTTGEKLPENEYKGDLNDLNNKYDKWQQDYKKGFKPNPFGFVKYQFFAGLFLICKECNLPVNSFKISISRNREYNPITKTARAFRKYFAFELLEYDIKSANPTFVDLLIKTNLKNEVYSNLEKSLNITRTEAKILYNKYLNSGKYNSLEKQQKFFNSCGYSNENSIELSHLTNDKENSFYNRMTIIEFEAIEIFVQVNKLKNYTRLHDAILLFKAPKNNELKQNFQFTSFGKTQLNEAVKFQDLQFSIDHSKKNIQYSKSAITKEIQNEFTKVVFKQVTGIANQVLQYKGISFYDANKSFVSANFDINNKYKNKFTKDFYTSETFSNQINKCFNTIKYLNPSITESEFKSLKNLIISNVWLNGVFKFNIDFNFNDSKILVESNIRNYDVSSIDKSTRLEFSQLLKKGQMLFNTKLSLKLIYENLKNNKLQYINVLDYGINNTEQNKYLSSIIKSCNSIIYRGLTSTKAEKYSNYLILCNKTDTSTILLSNITGIDIVTYSNRADKNRFVKWYKTLNWNKIKKQIDKQILELETEIDNIHNYEVETKNNRNQILEAKTQQLKLSNKIDFGKLDLSNSKLNQPINKTIFDKDLTLEKILFQYGLTDSEKSKLKRKWNTIYLEIEADNHLTKTTLKKLIN